ncbi:hypothetical protein J2W22_001262 [Sphingomonas kyeonggiensis]|uniref:DUF3892 domain-containing protein n=1 Tax=Sphingomonas kyeonggiensis TaxID=1268553 RepID=UPI002784BD49|nr:DUF3892 domain-containing protein [Sphingomonas kyeonggiensis]MDQ0249215.1 hypothetical protein [Sphingomonas kyeonggiensis]
MGDYQVGCIIPDGRDADRRIDSLGGPNFKTAPIDDVIRWIEEGHTFWVSVRGYRVNVLVRQHSNGRKYLTTEGDSFPPNNLLNLPHC